MTYPGAGFSYSGEEKDWFDRIVRAFPRGFHVVQDINPDVNAEIRMVSIDRMHGKKPLVNISAPFGGKFFTWLLEDVSEGRDGSWQVLSRAGTGLYRQRWTPLTDAQYRSLAEALDDAGFLPAEMWTAGVVAEYLPTDPHGGTTTHEENAVDAPEPEVDGEPPLRPTPIQENGKDLDGLQLAEGLFVAEDPTTGEVYPLKEPLLVLHCDASNTKLGLWQISEEQQIPLYPDDEAGRANRVKAQASLESYKGWKASWASVVDRITRSMDMTSRWYALANPDDLTLQEMFGALAIDQADDRASSGMGRTAMGGCGRQDASEEGE